jgi:hypothetical protein
MEGRVLPMRFATLLSVNWELRKYLQQFTPQVVQTGLFTAFSSVNFTDSVQWAVSP